MAEPAKLQWTDVDSSNVESVAYDGATHILCVRFHNGGLYSYEGVDLDVYVGLVHAESVGRYLNQVVKGIYPYAKWDSEHSLMADILNRRK